MSLFHLQVRDELGRPLWKTRDQGGFWKVGPEHGKGSRPFTIKDKERIENPPKRKKPTKSRNTDPFRKIGNAYMIKLSWAAAKIAQCAQAKRISAETMLAVLRNAYEHGEARWHYDDTVIMAIPAPTEHFWVLCFGAATPDGVPKVISPYIQNQCLDRWFSNIEENVLRSGCYTFVLSEDVLWGLIHCRLESPNEIEPCQPIHDNTIVVQEVGPTAEF